jgi:hypothetical protein
MPSVLHQALLFANDPTHVAPDPYFGQEVLLIQMNNTLTGVSGFVDVKGHTITNSGFANVTGVYPGPGLTCSGRFNSSYLSITSADLAFSANQAFCIEYYIYLVATGTNQWTWDTLGTWYLLEWVDTGNKSNPTFFAGSPGPQTPPTYTGATWYHVALTYDGSTRRTFYNGVLVFSIASGNVAAANPTTLEIGWAHGQTGGLYPFNGAMCGWRVTKGAARYTANFTPPSLPYPEY